MATKRTEQWQEEDLDLIMSLLEKDYTKAEPEKAPGFPPLYETNVSVNEVQEAVQEEPVWEEPAPEPVKKKSGKKGGLWAILSLEIVVLLGLIYWWVVRIL